MYLNATTNNNQTQLAQNYNKYIESLISIGNNVLNNTNFILDKKIDRFTFIKSKVLLQFF